VMTDLQKSGWALLHQRQGLSSGMRDAATSHSHPSIVPKCGSA
jgi:hypothetical protein